MVAKMGPCGGAGGGGKDMDTNGVNRIVRVIVNCGHTIDSVSILYERNGLEQWTDRWGGGGGGHNEVKHNMYDVQVSSFSYSLCPTKINGTESILSMRRSTDFFLYYINTVLE
jgi:hypothetical protein